MCDKQPQPVARAVPDLLAERARALQRLFPECVAEGRVDFDRLRAALGDLDALAADDGYTFSWAGKAEAFRAMQAPSAASLAPDLAASVNWDTTRHLFIAGENLEALKLLYKAYYGRIKMIYIDPPYNTGNDFIYQDDYRQPRRAYLEKTGQMDAQGNLLRSNPETGGSYHSDWLSMIYPRLFLARQLLREDGVIFVSIDDHEVHHLRLVMNEIFGEENFVATFVWKGRGGRQDSKYVAEIHEFVLMYARDHGEFSAGGMLVEGVKYPRHDDLTDRNYFVRLLRKWGSNSRRQDRPNLYYPVQAPDGTDTFPVLPDGQDGCWRWGPRRMEREIRAGNVEFVLEAGMWVGYERIWEPVEGELRTKKFTTWLDDTNTTASGTKELQALFDGAAPFDYPKPTALLTRLIQIADVQAEHLVLDFFAGSCTTAQAVLELNREDGGNRRFICIQIPEPTPEGSPAQQAGYATIADIGLERIRRVLARMQAPENGQLALELGERETPEDLGVRVFRLAPSTYRQWQPPEGEENAEALARQLALFDNGLEPGADPLHVLYETLLKEGHDLTAPIETIELAGARVYRIGPSDDARPAFYLCLESALSDEALDALPLAPETTFICLDTALDDSQKVNLTLRCKLKVI